MAHWFKFKNKCCPYGMACFEHYWKVLFTCEKWMPYSAFAKGLLFTFFLVTIWYLGNMQLFNGQIHRSNRSNKDTITKRSLFWWKTEGWARRNVTTLRVIDRAVNVRTDHPWYQHYCFNHAMRLYSVCLHLQCLQTLE